MIRRARRDGREARGNEERRRERIEKGSRDRIEKRERDKKIEFFLSLYPALRCSHCFFKSSGYDKLELKHKNVVFTSL